MGEKIDRINEPDSLSEWMNIWEHAKKTHA